MKTIKLTFLAVFVFAVFTECKKGENDPLISFRTRKARVEGKWKMKSGTRTQEFFGVTYVTVFSETTYHRTGSNGSTYEGTSYFKIDFAKDGALDMDRMLDFENGKLKGSWNFTGGVGKVKNKEQLVLHDNNTTVNIDLVYDIKELRNKKLVITRSMTLESGALIKEEYEFVQ